MVEKYLKSLIYELDCAVLPSFGGFLSSYIGAEISISKNKISPPKKKIVFNDKINTDDGKLKALIAKRESISLEEIETKIKEYVKLIRSELSTKTQYNFDTLGRLYLNNDGYIFFEQFNRFNYNKDSFGLPDLYFKPIDRTKDVKTVFKAKSNNKSMATNLQEDNQEELENEGYENNSEEYSAQNEGQEYEEENQKSSRNLTVYYVLAVVALLFTAGTAYYLNMDKNTYAVGSFNPLAFLKNDSDSSGGSNIENKLLPNSEDTAETASEQVAEQPDETSYPSSEPAPVEVKAKTKSNRVNRANLVEGQTGRFYIIAGGFKSKSKAVSLLNRLISEGQPSKLISPYDDKNMYRVSISDFAAYDEANGQKQQLASSYGSELWILTY